jgi:hypothetical protein
MANRQMPMSSAGKETSRSVDGGERHRLLPLSNVRLRREMPSRMSLASIAP